MTSLALVMLGAALAALAAHGRELARVWSGRPHGVSVEEAMSADVHAISAQLTVEEVTHGALGPSEHPVYAVTDAGGRAVGVLLRDDLLHIPHHERPARLVGDVARAAVVDRGAELAGALERPDVAGAGTAVVVDDHRRPVGLLRVGAARPAAEAVAADVRGEDGLGPLAADARPS
ncbi:MAG TPA: hypothetical protein VFT50_07465 [Baekduia sp.]|nr:hypothetical protein [Baekduia sp.]